MEQKELPLPNSLLCIFYCEFDNERGPVLYCQTPSSFFSTDQFDNISRYLIPKPQFCGKLITVTAADDRKIMGFPVCIEDPKYERNYLIFNLGFVLAPDPPNACLAAADGREDGGVVGAEIFGPLVRKLAGLLQTLECESEFLFDPNKKAKLPGVLRCRIPLAHRAAAASSAMHMRCGAERMCATAGRALGCSSRPGRCGRS